MSLKDKEIVQNKDEISTLRSKVDGIELNNEKIK